jgi:hypothetical protein
VDFFIMAALDSTGQSSRDMWLVYQRKSTYSIFVLLGDVNVAEIIIISRIYEEWQQIKLLLSKRRKFEWRNFTLASTNMADPTPKCMTVWLSPQIA